MNRVNRMFLGFLCAALLLSLGSSVLAQVTASITGRIEDASGASVPDAMVTVTNLETGVARTTASESDGEYRVLSLAVGRYEVKAEKTGFRATVQTGINLVVGQQGVVSLTLEVGQVQQQVTVTAEAPLVNTTTASVSGLVGEQAVKDLPLNGRSFDNLITLNTGAVAATSTKASGAGAQQANMFAIAGRHWYENLFLVNGVEYMGPSQNHSEPGGPSGQLLGVDAVREFNVVSDTYGAEYGKRAGGQVSVVTQSGSNVLHGTAFEFFRNSVLDARNFFDPATIPPFKRNQFGGALGGPIKKDKTFIFGNYEGFRQRLGLSAIDPVPDANARLGVLPCNIIGSTTAIGGKPTGANCASTTDTSPRYLGTGSITLPTGQTLQGLGILDARSLPYLNNWWPLQTPGLPDSAGVGKSNQNALQSIQEDFGVVRADHTFSSTDQIDGTYLIDIGVSTTPLQDIFASQVVPMRSQIISIQETHIFSHSVINTATAGYSRSAWQFRAPPLIPYNQSATACPVSPTTPLVSASPCIPASEDWLVGVSNNFPGQLAVGGGNISNQIYSLGGTSKGTDTTAARNLFNYQDAIQIIHGRHEFSMGLWFNQLQSNEFRPTSQSGLVVSSSVSNLLQGAGTFSAAVVQTPMYWRQFEGAWFVQDNIQVRPNLSIRVGLRHEFTNGYNSANNKAVNYVANPGSTTLLSSPVTGSSPFTTNNSVLLFGPRVGIAYDPFGKGRTSIRAGFGTYYDFLDELGTTLDNEFPFNQVATFGVAPSSLVNIWSLVPVTVANAATTPPTVTTGSGASLAPPCGIPVNGVTQVATVASPTNCTKFAPGGIQGNAKTPTVEEWTLAIEQGITTNTSLRVAYVGSHGYHELVSGDSNQIIPQICTSAAGCLAGGTAVNSLVPATGKLSPSTVPQGSLYVPVANPLGLLPNPNLSAASQFFTLGLSSYNALQVELTRRFNHGLYGRASYTWSRNLDEEAGYNGDTVNEGANEDFYQEKNNWGPSNVNRTHQFVASGGYELPFGKNKPFLSNVSGVGDKLASGWQVNWIVTVLSGFPFTPQLGFNESGDGNSGNPDRASLNPNWSGPIVNPNPKSGACGVFWVNSTRDANCNILTFPFAVPTLGTYGNMGRDSLIGPNLRELDLSLFKKTTIKERISAEFRAEAFNILNRTNFASPGLGMFSGNATSSTFNSGNAGLVSATAADPRRIQFGMKIIF